VKVLFFSQDTNKVEQLVLALRLRWPDLRPLVASNGKTALDVIENESPELAVLC
jgi:hypothetical protein